MLKRLFSFLVAILISVSPVLTDAKTYRSSYGNPSNNSKSSIHKTNKSTSPISFHTSRTYRLQRSSAYPKSTYKIGNTKYKSNETYKTSGLPKVQRSEAAKKQFLKSKGYDRIPPGDEVDHIIPLSKGGKDEPSNMQLIPKSVHKQKTASEKKR
jgi:5-methylcytosine-specific restriction endonuclease McrA